MGVSWAFELLPFMEQTPIYQSYRQDLRVDDPMNAMAMRTPVATFFCPSRRLPAADRDFDNDDQPSTTPGVAAGGDYAANAGDGLDEGGGNYDPANVGPIFTRSKINEREVTDGLSNTFVIGEKYIAPLPPDDMATPGREHARQGDCAIFAGDSRETILRSPDHGFPTSAYDPLDVTRFSGDHSQQTHFAFLDGSVHPISHNIDPQLYEAMGDIADDKLVPQGTFN
jgi:prepilin-type processing-associated H-X9-DG protein